VHPQELMTFSFIALLPVLVNLYFATTAWSSGVELKLWSVLSQVSWAKAELAHKQNKKGNNLILELIRFKWGEPNQRNESTNQGRLPKPQA